MHAGLCFPISTAVCRASLLGQVASLRVATSNIESVGLVPYWEWDLSTISVSVEMCVHCQLITMPCEVPVLQTTYNHLLIQSDFNHCSTENACHTLPWTPLMDVLETRPEGVETVPPSPRPSQTTMRRPLCVPDKHMFTRAFRIVTRARSEGIAPKTPF